MNGRLTAADIERFMLDGFLGVRGAVPAPTVTRCQDMVWRELAKQGIDRGDRATWTKPVVRIPTPSDDPFTQAGDQAALSAAYDQLIGPGRWIRKQSIGGTIPVRFPSETDPGDAAWHIDSSFRRADDEPWRVNVHSRGRGLLALFLLTDVGPNDAPTRLLRGSHMDIPRVLERFGEDGIESVGQDLMPAGTFDREVIYATGRAGDVFLCHPFLVHAASWPHRGTRPAHAGAAGGATFAVWQPVRFDGWWRHLPGGADDT